MKYFYGNDDTAKDKDNSNDINNQEKTKQEEIINTEKQDKEKDQISSPLQLSSTLSKNEFHFIYFLIIFIHSIFI